MKNHVKTIGLVVAVPFLLMADLSPDAPLGFVRVREAAAFIGAPMTPMSYAGVARRTTRRVVAVEATEVTAAGSRARKRSGSFTSSATLPPVMMPRTVGSLIMRSRSVSCVVRRDRCSSPASLSITVYG